MSVLAEEHGSRQNPVLASIPAFPPIALRVLDLASREDADLHKLDALIRADAVFSAQVLRMANSPLFGHTSQIESLHAALVTLGLERLQGLAMTVATSNYLRAALQIEELRRCWRHTLACAILCRELARAASLPEDLGYTVGLLHDIGRLGLLVAHPNEYTEMLREADREPLSLLDLEQRRFGMDHCEVGRRLAVEWNLPADFPVILGRHHDPPSGNSLDLLGIVYHGCRLADALGYAVLKPLRPASVEEIHATLPPQVAERFATDPAELVEMVEEKLRLHESGDPGALIAPANVAGGTAAHSQMPDDETVSPAAWDVLVVATTAIVILAVLAGCVFFWRP